MVVLGISYKKGNSKKTGAPYEAYVLAGVARSQIGEVYVDSLWISPQEYTRSGVKVGDTIRSFRDGGILIVDSSASSAVSALVDLI